MVRRQVPSLPVQGLSGWSKYTQIILTFILIYFRNFFFICDQHSYYQNECLIIIIFFFFFFFNTHFFYTFRAREAVGEDVRVLASADDMSCAG